MLRPLRGVDAKAQHQKLRFASADDADRIASLASGFADSPCPWQIDRTLPPAPWSAEVVGEFMFPSASPISHNLATSRGNLRSSLYSPEMPGGKLGTGQSRRVLSPQPRDAPGCHDLQFSPDGELMALASYDGSVWVRDFATGTVVAELPAHPDQVFSASFSPDGRLLVTACRDHMVRVWDWWAFRRQSPAAGLAEHHPDPGAAPNDRAGGLDTKADRTRQGSTTRPSRRRTPSNTSTN